MTLADLGGPVARIVAVIDRRLAQHGLGLTQAIGKVAVVDLAAGAGFAREPVVPVSKGL